jgi:hypothetical protein
MQITLLYEPSAERKIPFAAGAERYRRFAEELGRYAGTPVRVVEGYLKSTHEDGYILFAGSGDVSRSLAECGRERAAQLAPRILLLDVSWQRALEQLERNRLAGAVDSLRMSEWLAHPSSCTGPFGLRYLTKAIGASCVPLPGLRSRHYCLLESKSHRGMPHLLADYLTAYDRDQKPLNALPSVALARFVKALVEETSAASQKTAGRIEQPTPLSLVEFVSTKRAVASLKPVRELAGMTLLQIGESVGLDPEQLGLLEQGDLARTTLGTLRGYVIALEPKLGWTLIGLREASSSLQRKTKEQAETGGTSDRPIIVSGTGAKVTTTDIPASTDLPMFSPIGMMVQGGLTVMGQRRIRRQQPEDELDTLTPWTWKEKSYAGV